MRGSQTAHSNVFCCIAKVCGNAVRPEVVRQAFVYGNKPGKSEPKRFKTGIECRVHISNKTFNVIAIAKNNTL